VVMHLLLAKNVQGAINLSFANGSGVFADFSLTEITDFDFRQHFEVSIKDNLVCIKFALGLQAWLSC